MIKIVTYKYQVNALFVSDSLNNLEIENEVREIKKNKLKLFEIFVNPEKKDKAREIISELDIDDSLIDADSDGYLDGHEELTNNMYNPGHFTGGNMPHYTQDKSNWTLFIMIFIISAVLILHIIIASGDFDIVFILFLLFYVILILSLIRQIRKRNKKKNNGA